MIIKTDKDKRKDQRTFTRADNGFIIDPRLSLKAKGIMIYLLSKRSDWNPIAADIARHSHDSLTSVGSGMKELEEFGYLVRKRTRRPDGTFGYEATIYEVPLAEIPGAVDPGKDEPAKDKPQEEGPGETTTERTTTEGVTTERATTDATTSDEQLGENSLSKEEVRAELEERLSKCEGESYDNLRTALDSGLKFTHWMQRGSVIEELEGLLRELNIPLEEGHPDTSKLTSGVLDAQDRWAALVALVQDRADLAVREWL